MEIRPNFGKQELIPAIVQDCETKKVLMLAYVNKESYDLMLERKETYFYSRSRNEIWHKGEKSGNIQYVKEMYLDCDKDTLLILVEQNGVACHTGNYSCFFNEVIKNDKEKVIFNNVIEEVYLRILDRKKNPKENSYTNYLLEQGTDKICKKIGEEATETVIAAKNKIKEETIGEICDLIYHILVLMLNQEINLEEIEQKLKERHKIECNKKQFNVRGEY